MNIQTYVIQVQGVDKDLLVNKIYDASECFSFCLFQCSI